MAIRPTLNLLAAAVIGLAGASAAQAQVDTWAYEVEGIWTAFTPASVELSADQKTLSWGSNDSSLVINDPSPGQVDTFVNGAGGTVGDGITITHNNFVITGESLTSATLRATLNLEALVPPSPGLPGELPPLFYDIAFSETPNVAGTCASVTPVGPPCNDIFVLLNNEQFSQSFDFLGFTYTVDVFAAGGATLRDLTAAECAEAGVAAGCRGFTTIENASTELPFGFTISRLEQAVPEPGVLALLGIGLAAVGYTSRRRRPN